jgi:hypothetical protein
MNGTVKLVVTCALLSAFAGHPALSASAAGREDVVREAEVAGPSSAEPGAWRTKTQQVFDSSKRMLIRRLYTVWGPEAFRDLDFVWVADSLADDTEGPVNGQGRLLWRVKGKPAYDPAAIVAEFRGAMKSGRPEGQGTYFDPTGLTYEGEWKNGLMEGQGRLKLPSGDEYVGQFRAGKANGAGRYVDVTGEIFEGQFVDGLRDGRGTTTLPNGFTYRSTWSAGKEAEGSRTVRLAQVGGQRLPGGSDDLRIAVTVDPTGIRDGDFRYTASNVGPGVSIAPANRRVMDLWKRGGEIQLLPKEDVLGEGYGVLSLSRGQLFPLTLQFEVLNRSSAPIQVSGGYLDVRASVSDLQPAIQLAVGPFECTSQPNFRPEFRLENFGWGAAERAAVRFAFANPMARTRPAALPLAKSVGRIDSVTKVDFEPELQAAGVNTGLLKQRQKSGLACTSTDPQACLGELRGSGVFGSLGQHLTLDGTNILLGVVGTLEYIWANSRGQQQNAVSPFNAGLLLGHTVRDLPCGELGESDPITKTALEFRLDQSAYRLPIGFQRAIPAGRTSRFAVPVQAAKSSQHEFRVVMQLADGREISSQPVSLLYYRPKWFPGS